MAQNKIEAAKAQRADEIDSNRAIGVVEYKSGEAQADAVYEVIEGYKHLPGVGRIGPGQRFHPTENQHRTGSLKGKARELTRTEYDSVSRAAKYPGRGADFPAMERRAALVEIPMAEGTREMAVEAGLTADDFENRAPGYAGKYTREQVESFIAAKTGEDETDDALDTDYE